MGAISFLLILESLVFYAVGAVVKAGKSVELRPQIIDFVIIVFIWAAAIYSSIILDLNRWLLISAWVIVSMLVGVLAVWPRKSSGRETSRYESPKPAPRNIFKRLWQGWEDFIVRLGGFQTRMIFSLCFFILVSPVALAVNIFRDPLRLKYRKTESYWLTRAKTLPSLERFRKQF